MLDDKTDLTVEFVSRNLATTSNFIEFRDSRNFMFFEALRVAQDTWHTMSGSQCAMCQVRDASNGVSSSGVIGDMWHHGIEWKSKVDG